MPTFAHIESGVAMDPMVFPSQQAYLANFSSGITAAWQVTQVDDGSVDGATLIDGKWTNPAAANPVTRQSQYQSLSQIGFITLCQEAGGMTDAMLVVCQGDGNFAAMWIKFRAADQLDHADGRVQAGLAGLALAGYLPNGVAAVNAAWPVV